MKYGKADGGCDLRQRVSVGSLSFGLTCGVRGFC
jgi:hypothetical protein